MESSLTKYEVIKQNKDIPYSKSNHYLIKMHGDLELRNIVLKEDDYLDYEDKFYMISTLIKSLIMNNTILFVGYSLNDSTFNSIFRIIQKGFGTNAKQSYFYTISEQNTAAVEYYKNKGIRIISDNIDIDKTNIGKATENFLSQLVGSDEETPKTAEQLWQNINFLDQLFFISTDDIVRYAKFSSKDTQYLINEFKFKNEQRKLDILKNDSLVKFFDTKTYFINFLDYNKEKNYEIKQNPVLLSGYKLYQKHQYYEAKKEFRKIANQAFIRNDYWNYLIAEFNVKHIALGMIENIELAEPINGTENINKVIESLILNGDGKTKKLCMYFRNEIQSFKFIYSKVYKVNDILDDMCSYPSIWYINF